MICSSSSLSSALPRSLAPYRLRDRIRLWRTTRLHEQPHVALSDTIALRMIRSRKDDMDAVLVEQLSDCSLELGATIADATGMHPYQVTDRRRS